MDVRATLLALQRGEIEPEEAQQKIEGLMDHPSEADTKPTSTLSEEVSDPDVVEIKEIEPGIALITMQDRANKNMFTLELITGLFKAFEWIKQHTEMKVAILTGYDTYFASGGGREGLLELYEGKSKMTDLNLYTLPMECEIPVIAAMQGHALGGGWCFGMFSDFVLMSEESFYTCNHMKYGFTPGDGATLIFPEKLGYSIAREVLYTGNRYRGKELIAKGVTTPIIPRKEVMNEAIQLAKDLAQVPRESLILLKKHMTDPIKERLDETLKEEWEMQEKTFVNKPEVLKKILSTFDQSAPSTASASSTRTASHQELIHLNKIVEGSPVFWIHSEGGGVEGYQMFSQSLTRPFYGIQARGRMNDHPPIHSIPKMAEYYIELIRRVQPTGPYDLGGYSLGGAIAYEMTRLLQERGETVRTLVMIDTLDTNGMQNIEQSKHSKRLQAVNLSIINRVRREPELLFKRMIHQKEVNFELQPDAFLNQLIQLGTQRGLSMAKSEAELTRIFEKNLLIQEAFEEKAFKILPLSDPDSVTAYYFRNNSNAFYGDFEPYFVHPSSDCTIDQIEYWKQWEKQFGNWHPIDVDASNHFSLLFESPVFEVITRWCDKIYSLEH
ncbi:polyketide synthase [Marininema halotolerans]|uniref:Enoyl-CoA hydratase/carnithine racemase n=1 Tax=Marininema halotolerans TaxID=1155944 RepID=A0A1I6PQ89_9BACL|nr:polyketide synthase [Marininema halotolerans]SFS42290.1 Enoyl-CoA hydratase/carnithine racemase [Marininema halotolerans]